MDVSNPQTVGWSAFIAGIVAAIGLVCLILLFVVGEPFGTLNDLLTIPTALLIMPLVFALFRLNAPHSGLLSAVALTAGVVGFTATAVGSTLLVLGRITFLQSLIPGIGGCGLIALWAVLNAVVGLRSGVLPPGAAWAGIIIGLPLTVALLFVFSAGRIEQMLTGMAGFGGVQMNPMMVLFFIPAFIGYAGLPFWFMLMGRLFLSGRISLAAATLMA